MTFVIGIDIGTASTKGVLVNPHENGTIVATARRDHEMELPRPGWAQMDADAVWYGDVVGILQELGEQAGERGTEIAGICISGMGPCVVQADEFLTPRSDAVLYGIDGRATREMAWMTQTIGDDVVLQRCGKELSTQAVGPKIKWLIDHTDAQADDRWYGCHTYVLSRLGARWVLDHHTASQCDPLYDINEQDWAHDLAAAVLPDTPLPELVWPGDVVGELDAAAAEVTGLVAGTPLVCGTVDAWAEAFSAGARKPGDLMLMYGSTLFIVQFLEGLAVRRGLWTTAGIERGTLSLAAGMSTSGSLTQWVQKLTGGAPFEQLVDEAGKTPPGSAGLVTLPYFAGERSPIFDPEARGVLFGLNLTHTRGHIFRSVYEGIACGIRQIVDMLSEADAPAKRVFAVGGGTQGGLWTQIVSDVTGLEQIVPTTTLGAAYGDALLAAIGTGIVPPETDWVEAARIVKPDETHRETYEKVFAVYDSLYPATKSQMHELGVL